LREEYITISQKAYDSKEIKREHKVSKKIMVYKEYAFVRPQV